MKDKNPFIETGKYLIRYLLQLPSCYKPSGKPHIFLFSTRRSGSTLVRDIIYSQSGFNYIDQPFDLTQYNQHIRQLPQAKLGQFINLTNEEEKQVERYVRGILNRQYVFRSQWQLWNGQYKWCWERYIVKVLTAKGLIHWFESTFKDQIQIIYMTRHPIPTSLSILNRRWGLTTQAYLENETFIRDYLSDSKISFTWDILRSGSKLEHHVLNWCLENLVPLKGWSNSNWLTLSYEKLLTDPHYSTRRLCQKLDLKEAQKMLTTLNVPTRTAVHASKVKIIAQGAEVKLGTWQNQISSSEIRKINAILEMFEIDLYQAHKILPRENFDTH